MVTVYKTEAQRQRDEARRAHAEAARAAAATEALRGSPKSNLPEIIGAALEAFAKPFAAKIQRVETEFAAYVGRRFAEEKAKIDDRITDMRRELVGHIDAELSLSVRDIRSTYDGMERQAERIANRAADRACERAVMNLLREVDELRREVAALKAERNGNVRVLR